ncbi:MAG: hypothetical protein GY791_09425 [Alphaproteobacteria bacterium]|nr:hypothetical protein [Alphaproteobacteria bacterium]
MTAPNASASHDGTVAAVLLVVFFFVLHAWMIDYGTAINDVPSIRDYRFDSSEMARQFTDRDQVAGVTGIGESVAKRMMRFKLYSIHPDEHKTLRALQRIQPAKLQFDPRSYLYGGAYLYPLGGWLFGLLKAGVIEIGSLDSVVNSIDGFDRVYIAGRLFVLLAFSLSAIVFYRTLILVADRWAALSVVGIYLFAPITIGQAMLLKPHWYALLWVCLGLHRLTGALVGGRIELRDEIWIAVFLGLAVSSSAANGYLSILFFAVLVGLATRDLVSWSALVRVPAVAVAVFALTSPFTILSFRRVRAESEAVATLRFDLDPDVIWVLVEEFYLAGIGIAATVVLVGLVIYGLVLRRGPITWWPAAVILLSLVLVGYGNHWLGVGGARFAGFLLPITLLLVVRQPWPGRAPILLAAFALTVAQALPLELAHIDENDPVRGTRLRIAQWVGENIAEDTTICIREAQPAPFNAPPLDWPRWTIVAEGCQYWIVIAPSHRGVRPIPGFDPVEIAAPRLWQDGLRVVHGWVNPHITVYRRTSRTAD